MSTSGPQLRIERIIAGVTMVALAERLKVSRQALWAWERAAEVKPYRVAQYRAAVAELSDDATVVSA